ncbi:hypothetical protein S83_005724 [Arachis hypogaea]
MWAIRCLPLRNRVLRAYCSKATWVVEDDSGTSKRMSNTLPSLHVSSNVETSHGKIKLDLAGEGFLPSLTTAHAISDIIKGHYSQPWPSWKKIPDATRKFWWEKFKVQRLHVSLKPTLNFSHQNFLVASGIFFHEGHG